MKYTVMECHEGYAVLMGEDACFVRAANLHYSVGQTVTSPVILAEDVKRPAIRRSVFVKIAAVAACFMLISAVGLNYYRKNLKTHSVLTIGSDFNIQLEFNSKGKVIRMKSKTDDGKDVLDHYVTKDKNMVGAVNDILDVMKEQGYITNEDTVDLYISGDSKKDSESYKNEIEHEISASKLNISVVDKPPEPSQKKPVLPEQTDENKNREEDLPVPSKPAADNNENIEKLPVPSEPAANKTEKAEKYPVLPDGNAEKPAGDLSKPNPYKPEKDINIDEVLPSTPSSPEHKPELAPDVTPHPPSDDINPPYETPPYENKDPYLPPHQHDEDNGREHQRK